MQRPQHTNRARALQALVAPAVGQAPILRLTLDRRHIPRPRGPAVLRDRQDLPAVLRRKGSKRAWRSRPKGF